MRSLTRRELEIAKRIGAGEMLPDIRGAMFVSARTVRYDIDSIRRKLGVENRAEIAGMYARRPMREWWVVGGSAAAPVSA